MERYRADKLAVGPKLTHGEFVELLLNLADAAPCHLADPGTPCMSSIGITRNLPKAELHTAPSPLTSSCSTSSGEPGNLLKRELDVKASHLLHLGAPYSSMSGMAGSSTDEDLDGALALVSLAAPVSKNETNNFASIGHHMASPNANADARSVQHFEALPPYGDSKSQPSSTARFLAFQSDIPINHPPQPASLQLTVNHMATVAYPTAPPYRSSLGPVDTSEPLPPYLHTESDVKSETSAKGKDCIVGRESHLYKLASLSTDDLSMLDAVSSSLEGPAWNAFDKPASTSAQPLTGEYHAAFGAHSHAVMDEPLPSYERSIADADSDLELDVKFGDEGADAMECDSSAFDPSTPGIGLDLLADDPLFLPLDAWVSPPGISEADALVWSYEPDLSEPMLTWDLEEGLDSLSDFISFEVSVPPDLKDPE
ncbi:hypothetical protein HKX48_000548 [Thoreauomyces humboldtii]|nr:hypothetical protein HKX48_000548 [Thoreauomyces humboldtii]